jgi:hypothetical protein
MLSYSTMDIALLFQLVYIIIDGTKPTATTCFGISHDRPPNRPNSNRIQVGENFSYDVVSLISSTDSIRSGASMTTKSLRNTRVYGNISS